MPEKNSTMDSLVADHRVVVCVGSGGVGKTTVAAAVALHGARRGRRTMVLTIDPARRLAQSLGLDSLASGGEPVPVQALEAAGISLSGRLSAGMLDQKSAWDDFIGRHAPSDDVRDAILGNDFYRHLSGSFAGSAEYMAIEELCRIQESDQFDLIVLDTPPSRHALEFLEAPERMRAFLDGNAFGRLLGPSLSAGWAAWKSASRGGRFLASRLEAATGVSALTDIAEFFVAMERLLEGIGERGGRVQELLRGDRTAFVLVAGPEEQVLDEAETLTQSMSALRMPLRAVVFNRTHPMPESLEGGADPARMKSIRSQLVADGISEDAVAWLEQGLDRALARATAEEVRREAFELGLPDDVVCSSVAEMDSDPHDLVGLLAVGDLLMGPIR